MAPLVGIAPHLRAVRAPHVALQLMDPRRLRPPHDVKCDGLMSVAAEATDFAIEVACIERVTERGRGLRRPFEGKHALGSCLAGELVGFLARLRRTLRRHSTEVP
jgi:hypothetical protein